jgi:hypothetical protein
MTGYSVTVTFKESVNTDDVIGHRHVPTWTAPTRIRFSRAKHILEEEATTSVNERCLTSDNEIIRVNGEIYLRGPWHHC